MPVPPYKLKKKTEQAILKSARDMLTQGTTPRTSDLSELHLQDCPLHERSRRKLISALLDDHGIERLRSSRITKNQTIDLTEPDESNNGMKADRVVELGRFKIKSVEDFKKAFEAIQKKIAKTVIDMPRDRPIDVDRYLVDQARAGNSKAFDLLQRVIES